MATRKARSTLNKAMWFALLWCAGVGGALLLALPFHYLVKAAIAAH